MKRLVIIIVMVCPLIAGMAPQGVSKGEAAIIPVYDIAIAQELAKKIDCVRSFVTEINDFTLGQLIDEYKNAAPRYPMYNQKFKEFSQELCDEQARRAQKRKKQLQEAAELQARRALDMKRVDELRAAEAAKWEKIDL